MPTIKYKEKECVCWSERQRDEPAQCLYIFSVQTDCLGTCTATLATGCRVHWQGSNTCQSIEVSKSESTPAVRRAHWGGVFVDEGRWVDTNALRARGCECLYESVCVCEYVCVYECVCEYVCERVTSGRFLWLSDRSLC